MNPYATRPLATVTVHAARDLPRLNRLWPPDPYVVVRDADTRAVLLQTSVVKGALCPTWTVANGANVTALRVTFEVYDKNTVKKDKLFGSAAAISTTEPREFDEIVLAGKRVGGGPGGPSRIVVSIAPITDHRYIVDANTGLGRVNPWSSERSSMSSQTSFLPITTSPEDMHKILPSAKSTVELDGSPTAIANLHEHRATMSRHEIPMGLLQRLDAVARFSAIDIIVDDSGSMAAMTDMLHPETSAPMNRWQEVKTRLLWLIEVLAMAPTLPPITIRFLNRTSTLRFDRGIDCDILGPSGGGATFLRDCAQRLDREWRSGPMGGTPVIRALQASFAAHAGKPTIRYFFGDGVPNEPTQQVVDMIMYRADPVNNPFTFFSCTNEDAQTQWMKECEEAAPYCAEYDDFQDESTEIVHDQGPAFPFSRGLYLMGCAIGVCYPDDLDAMDEGVPLTKVALDGILGYITTDLQYQAYFDGMVGAQIAHARSLSQLSAADHIKFSYAVVWSRSRAAFATARSWADLPEVRDYRNKMQRAVSVRAGRC